MKYFLTCLNHFYNVEEFAEAWISPAFMETLGRWNSRRRNISPSWKKTTLVLRQFLYPCNNTDLQLAQSQCFLPTLGADCLGSVAFQNYCLFFEFLSALFRPWCCWSFSTTWVPVILLPSSWPGVPRTAQRASLSPRMWWNALDMCVIRDYGKKQN